MEHNTTKKPTKRNVEIEKSPESSFHSMPNRLRLRDASTRTTSNRENKREEETSHHEPDLLIVCDWDSCHSISPRFPKKHRLKPFCKSNLFFSSHLSNNGPSSASSHTTPFAVCGNVRPRRRLGPVAVKEPPAVEQRGQPKTRWSSSNSNTRVSGSRTCVLSDQQRLCEAV